MLLVLQLKSGDELVYAVKKEFRGAIDGVDELTRMLLKVGELGRVSRRRKLHEDVSPVPRRCKVLR